MSVFGLGRSLAGRVVGRELHRTLSPISTSNHRGYATAGGAPSVLLLGSGMVVAPVVNHLAGAGSAVAPNVTIASMELAAATELAAGSSRATPMELDVSDPVALDAAVKAHDLIISLVPAPFHVGIAEACINNNTNMLTTSYVSPEMQELDARAVEAGITILNECGLDPGLDHLAAMKIIDDVKERGGKIESFRSYCGGLPAPDDSDVPLKYKFSWSPRGVLTAGLNSATYREDGEVKHIAGGALFGHAGPLADECFQDPEADGAALDLGELEGYPNRNSLLYEEVYDIAGAETVIRGTIRYAGFSVAMRAFQELGMFNLEPNSTLETGAPAVSWPRLMLQLLGAPEDVPESEVEWRAGEWATEHYGVDNATHIVSEMSRLSLFDCSSTAAPAAQSGTIIDSLCRLLEEQLAYGDGERDMVVLSHEFVASWPSGAKTRHSADLIELGVPNGDTSMATTVGTPCALAADMILSGAVERKGVLRPIYKEIYEPLLQKLEEHGIAFQESESEL